MTAITNIDSDNQPDSTDIRNSNYQHYAAAPKITGIDGHNKQYSITADYITQEKDLVFMHNAKANMYLSDTIMAIISAYRGRFFINTDKIILYSSSAFTPESKNNDAKNEEDKVAVNLGIYGIIQSTSIEVLYKEGMIIGKDSVKCDTPFGILNGGGFIIDNNKHILELSGPIYAAVPLAVLQRK